MAAARARWLREDGPGAALSGVLGRAGLMQNTCQGRSHIEYELSSDGLAWRWRRRMSTTRGRPVARARGTGACMVIMMLVASAMGQVEHHIHSHTWRRWTGGTMALVAECSVHAAIMSLDFNRSKTKGQGHSHKSLKESRDCQHRTTAGGGYDNYGRCVGAVQLSWQSYWR